MTDRGAAGSGAPGPESGRGPTRMDPSLNLTRAGPDDSPALVAILSDPSVARWWGDFDERRVRRELLGEDETWVIEVDGRPAGFILVGEETDPMYRHASLDIAVGAPHQGHGVGRGALTRMIAGLFARGHHRITIDPRADNARAIRAYTAVGFRTVGRMRMYERGADGNWHDGVLMELLAHEWSPGDGATGGASPAGPVD